MCVPPDVCCMLWTKLSVLTQPSVPPVVCIGHLAVLSCKIVQHCASTHCIVTSRHGPRTAALLRRLKRSDGSVELGQHQIQLGLVPLHRLRQTRAHTQRQTRGAALPHRAQTTAAHRGRSNNQPSCSRQSSRSRHTSGRECRPRRLPLVFGTPVVEPEGE